MQRRGFSSLIILKVAAVRDENVKRKECRVKVTEIEVHEIALEYHDWIAYPLNHYKGGARRTVYVERIEREGMVLEKGA